MDLRGKRALVMGLGIHGGGLGVARFLVSRGAIVSVTDMRTPEQLKSSIDALADLPIRYVLGEHREEDFGDADLVVRNPGVPRESRFLQIARDHGAAIEMEMTLFFRLCPGPILGITGTKGKTTTTLLTGAMLREQYPDTVVAGNLRVSALEALPRITAGTPVVLELSSWQLEGLGEAQLSPTFACVTNLSADHLDRYGSLGEYALAKAQIIAHQGADGIAVRNLDDQFVVHMAEQAASQDVWFSCSDIERNGPFATAFERISAAYWRGDELIWKRPAEKREVICRTNDISLPGAHNLANVAAAAALAKSFGIENDHIRSAIRNFAGVEHRLEFVRELDGVRFVNDTAATAPEAAIAALYSFKRPVVLIAGGADKNLPFDGLARAIRKRAKAVVLLEGTATPKMLSALRATDERSGTKDQTVAHDQSSLVLGPSSFVTGPFGDFAKAIAAARELAEPGDVVLLSPGCASFGMFRNEFHRGEEFRRIVNQF
jgi:UDP-N-acetylmuramoylalanine--D-glutamate ligase